MLLSRGPSAFRDAGALLHGAAVGRDQQHLLRMRAPRCSPVGGAGAGRVPLRPEGVAADHPPQTAEGRGGLGGLLLSGREQAGRPAGADPLSAPAQLPQGPAPVPGLPRDPSGGMPGRLRVPARVLVRRGGLRGPPRAPPRLCVAEDEKLATPSCHNDWGYLRWTPDFRRKTFGGGWPRSPCNPGRAYVFSSIREGKGPMLADALADFPRLKAFFLVTLYRPLTP